MAYIIIKHPVHAPISDEECLNAIPVEFKQGDAIITEIKPVEMALGEGPEEWDTFAQLQRTQFQERLKSILEQHTDAPVFYFGFAPIPLIVHLGSLMANWRRVYPMFRTHDTHEWLFEEENGPALEWKVSGLPQDENLSANDVSLNIGISYRVNPAVTQIAVGASLMKSVVMETAEQAYDQLNSQDQLLEFGDQLETIFRTLLDKFPNLGIVHVFASIPIPAAFVLGHKIQPNIYPVVQTYQFKSTEEKRYSPAVAINQPQEERPIFTPEQIKLAKKYRKSWNAMLTGQVRRFIQNLSEKPKQPWYAYLDTSADWSSFEVPYWSYLEPLCVNKLLVRDQVSQEKTDVSAGFIYDQSVYEWSMDNSLFVSLSNRLKEETSIHKAGRLFLFHETLHYSCHHLNSQVADGIGSFPKVIEESDYQADVYALLHEYAWAKLYDDTFDAVRVKEWFVQTIHIMTETMWSFEDRGVALKEIQIRRLNRFMMWYWQAVRIKYADSLKDILDILSEKPVIEFSGLSIRTRNQRVFYNLDLLAEHHCEMAIYMLGKVTRTTPPNYMDLVEGFKERDGEKIKNVMEMFFKTII